MRYSRQEKINGWDQRKITNAHVSIVGSNFLSYFLAADLIAMGFGKVVRLGGFSPPFLDLNDFNPDSLYSEFYEIPTNSKLLTSQIFALGRPNFIVDTTNSKDTKRLLDTLTKEEKINLMSASTSNAHYSISMQENTNGAAYQNSQESDSKSRGLVNEIIAAGIIAEEIRKRIMPLNDEKNLKRLSIKSNEHYLGGVKTLQVGAGAIGTYAAISLCLAGAENTVVDFDKAELSNLSRQILFHDSLGNYKSETLAEKLSNNGYPGKTKSLVDKVTWSFVPSENYDMILGCVDNTEARLALNTIAKKYNIPFLNAGTSVGSGSVMPFFPGRTACIDCQLFGYLSQSVKEEKQNQKSCYEPSIITTNQIIGAAQVQRIHSVLFNQDLRTLKYDSNKSFSYHPTLDKCLGGCSQ